MLMQLVVTILMQGKSHLRFQGSVICKRWSLVITISQVHRVNWFSSAHCEYKGIFQRSYLFSTTWSGFILTVIISVVSFFSRFSWYWWYEWCLMSYLSWLSWTCWVFILVISQVYHVGNDAGRFPVELAMLPRLCCLFLSGNILLAGI